MRESEFNELRSYAEAPEQCIDMGYRPGSRLIGRGWLREIVRGCWQITSTGQAAFSAVVEGRAELEPDAELEAES